MGFNLLEDNKSIEESIKYLDSKIVKLRTSQGLSENLKKELISIYDTKISPWTKKYYLMDKETSQNEEEEMLNIILETINIINKFIK